MAQYTTIIDYCLYDFNDKKGRTPFLDDSTTRATLAAKIRGAVGLSDS
jgi:hypothetical protein